MQKSPSVVEASATAAVTHASAAAHSVPNIVATTNSPDSPSGMQKSRIPVRCKTPPSSAPHQTTTQDFFTQYSNGQSSEPAAQNELWVFGYGSLVWKVDFPVAESLTGYIRGYQRRFYQHSIDHRGTPEKPGRVVTLIPVTEREARVYGVAYRIPADQHEAVIEHLDHREKNGYDRHTVDFYPYPEQQSSPATTRRICLYVASADNESFAGEMPMAELAAQVHSAHGPSGPNVEYVFRLAEAMRSLFPGEPDEHLFELERAVRALEVHNTPQKGLDH